MTIDKILWVLRYSYHDKLSDFQMLIGRMILKLYEAIIPASGIIDYLYDAARAHIAVMSKMVDEMSDD